MARDTPTSDLSEMPQDTGALRGGNGGFPKGGKIRLLSLTTLTAGLAPIARPPS